MQEILISKDAFGGLSILLFGDILQLPPVRGRPIFSAPFSQKNRSLFHSTENIWKNMEIVTLKVSQRHGVGEWTNCLNRIRTGDTSSEDKILLETRRLKHFPGLDTDEACHVAFTNLEVDTHNTKRLNALPTDLVHVQAGGMYPKGVKPIITKDGIVENTPFLKNLFLKKGARVMLTFNVNLSDSLVNGVLGTILDFVFEDSKVKAVIIEFDNPEVGLQHRKEHFNDCSRFIEQNGTPIYRSCLEHTMKKNGGAKGKTIQFPLRLAWSSTAHKLQGTTIKKGSNLIVHGHVKMPRNMYYVMLSRCSSLENVSLGDSVNLDNILCDQAALKEKVRMDEESVASKMLTGELDIFFINIRSFCKHKEDLQCDIFARKSVCICLAETWIGTEDNISHEFSGKSMFAASKGPGKGCCAILPMDVKHGKKICQDNFQLISFHYKQDIHVVLVYISQKADLKSVKKYLEEILMFSGKEILLGDFNFDSGERNVISSFLKRNNYHQLVQEPTQAAGRTIDHLYVSPALKDAIDLVTMFKYYSDHCAFHVKINV